jgi:hypothetical protein
VTVASVDLLDFTANPSTLVQTCRNKCGMPKQVFEIFNDKDAVAL